MEELRVFELARAYGSRTGFMEPAKCGTSDEPMASKGVFMFPRPGVAPAVTRDKVPYALERLQGEVCKVCRRVRE
jgi:hypothetical protein